MFVCLYSDSYLSILYALVIETSGIEFGLGDGRGLGKENPNLGSPDLGNKNKY